jgi:beta-fructofuranosidase
VAKPIGWQGAFTLFRDLSVKYIRNVDPSAPGLYEKGSWGVKNETDGSVTVYTLGQKVVSETINAYRAGSSVSTFPNTTLGSEGYTPLETQPSGRFYRL